MNQADLEKRIVARLVQAGQSMSSTALQRDLRDVDARLLSDAIRSLMESRKISLQQGENNERLLSLTNSLAENLALILDIVRSSGVEGVDQTTICSCAKLAKSEVTKALNQLIGQQRIKDIRCFTNKAKKLYMLYELEPSANVTGGTFYTDTRDIDSSFIDAVRAKVTHYIQQKAAASIAQIKLFLDAEVQTKRLSLHDVEVIVGSLELDGIIEQIPNTSEYELSASRSVARHGSLASPGAMLTNYPCVGCPYLERCGSAGVGAVNPVSCTYLTNWLHGALS
jgi:hypothetical protein